MNEFRLRGTVISYGTTKGKEWIDISTPDGPITVWLENDRLSDLEKDLDESNYVEATGYLKSYTYTDDVAVVATNIEVK